MNPDHEIQRAALDAIERDDAAALSMLAASGADLRRIGPRAEPACLAAAVHGSWRCAGAIARLCADPFAEAHALSWEPDPAEPGAGPQRWTLRQPTGCAPALAGRTALTEAVRHGRLLAAQALSELGADLDAQGRPAVAEHARVPVQVGPRAGQHADHVEVVGLDRDVDRPHAHRGLAQAAWAGRSRAASALILAGAKLSRRDASGATPKDIAKMKRRPAILSELEKAGAPSGPAGSRRVRWSESMSQGLGALAGMARRI